MLLRVGWYVFILVGSAVLSASAEEPANREVLVDIFDEYCYQANQNVRKSKVPSTDSDWQRLTQSAAEQLGLEVDSEIDTYLLNREDKQVILSINEAQRDDLMTHHCSVTHLGEFSPSKAQRELRKLFGSRPSTVHVGNGVSRIKGWNQYAWGKDILKGKKNWRLVGLFISVTDREAFYRKFELVSVQYKYRRKGNDAAVLTLDWSYKVGDS